MDLRGCWQSGHKKTRSGPVPWWTGPVFVLQLWIRFGCSTEAADKSTTVKGVIDVPHDGNVTITKQTIFTFNTALKQSEGLRVSVVVDVLPEGDDSPILVDVRQKQAVLSFQVPLKLRGSSNQTNPYARVNRTLCLAPVKGQEKRTFFVDVSTLSSLDIRYRLTVTLMVNFTLQTDKTFNFSASPSEPQYFKYKFDANVSTVIVKVTSEDKNCSVLSIQDDQCPVYDLYTNVNFMGRYLTFTKIGVMIVQKDDFPNGFFYVVVLVKPEDKDCGNDTQINAGKDAGYRTKAMQVVVSHKKREDYTNGILFCVGIFLSFYLLTILVWYLETLIKEETGIPAETEAMTVESLEEFLLVSALSREEKKTVSKTHHVYIWNIITIAVFYGLPVVQLFIGYQKVVNLTGRQDICYYNSLCAHPLGQLRAFNNVFSNLGYVLLGFLFILIVGKRHLHHRDLVKNSDHDPNILQRGIPKHFGLFYTMGTALVMEGVLSGCYHVCPKDTNFQFDTSFMYMIATLSMLQLYQKRHPDITASAHFSYAFLAAVVLISVLGEFSDRGGPGGWVFWSIFSSIHILAMLYLTIQLYYTSRWTEDSGILCRIKRCIRKGTEHRFIDRMVLLVIGNIVNWCLAVHGLVKRPKEFASHLLIIAICNMLLYFIYYIIMKLRSDEFKCVGKRFNKWLKLAIIGIFTAVAWGFALYFFFFHVSSWEKTPAESRELNKDCCLLSFFDHHDVWHFLSAIALFGTFLVLLIIDDDKETVQQDKICVF